MAINYSLALRLAAPGKPELGNKTYAVAQYNKILDTEALAEHMSQHNSKYNKGDILAVIMQLASCIREQLLLGNKVEMSDLGAFSLVLLGDGADNAESFSTSLIDEVKVKWTPSTKFSSLINDATFQFVGSRKSQALARAEEKARINSLATIQPDSDTGGNTGSDTDDDYGHLGE